MTQLEQYKKAYAKLIGDIDALTVSLKKIDRNFIIEGATLDYTITALIKALQDAEEVFMSIDPTDMEEPDPEEGETEHGEIHLLK